MHTHVRPGRPGRSISQLSTVGFHGDVYRRFGERRRAPQEHTNAAIDLFLGISRSFLRSFEECFGKATHDIEMDADAEMVELNEHVPGVSDKI